MTESSTIAAIATPHGSGGIAVIRISGKHAIEIAQRVFKSRSGRMLASLNGYSGALGDIIETTDEQNIVDEAITYVYHAPKSYTGEDIVEISCHGGAWLSAKILRLLYDNGAEPAAPGEFTKRAFLNGKMDLSQAEAVMDIISAHGESALNAAVNAHRGAVSAAVKQASDELLAQSAHLAAWADFPEEGLEEIDEQQLCSALESVTDKLSALIQSYDNGRIIKEGIITAIAGKPNAGKSTLMNMLSGYERSIVTDIPGTTRDIVTESVKLGAIILQLTDTAGIRETQDIVESMGVNLAQDSVKTAELVIAVFDSSIPIDENDEKLFALLKKTNSRRIAVINKTDLAPKLDIDVIKANFEYTVMMSAKNKEGLPELENAIAHIAGIGNIDTSAPVIASERQRKCLIDAKKSTEEAIEALNMGVTLDAVNICLDDAAESLLSLTGEKASERIIDEVFLRFCVGK